MVITTASMYKSLGEALAMESSHPPKIKEAYTQYLCCIEMLIDNMKTLATTDDTNFSLSIDKMYYFIRECTQRSEQLLLSHPHLFKQQQQQLSSAAAIPPSSSSLSYIITSPRSTQSDHQISQYKQQQKQQQHATNKINSPSNGTFLISDTCSTLTHNHNYNNSNDNDVNMNNSYYINAGDQQQHMVPTTTMKQKYSTYSPSDHQGMYPNINNQSQYIAEYFPNNQSQQQQQQQQFTNHPTIFDSSAPSVPILLPSSSSLSLSSSYHTTNHSSIHNQNKNNQTNNNNNNNTKNGDHMLLYHDELPWSYTPTSHTVNHTTVPSTSTIALANNRNSLQSSSSSAPPPPIPHSLLFNQQSKQQQQQSSHYYHPHHHIAKNEIEHWKQTFQKYQSKSRSLTRIINHQSFSSLLSLLSLVPLSSSSSSLAIPSTNHHHHHHHHMNHQRNNMVPYTSIPSLLYHSFDMNRSNEMEYEDWSQSMYVLLHGSHKDQIQFSYSMFDPNGIGYISKSMFIHTMTMMYELLNHMGIDLLMMMMTMNMKNKKTTTNSASTTSLGTVPNPLLYDESSPQASPSSFIAMIEYRMSQLFDSLFLSSSSVSVSSQKQQQQQNVTRNRFMNIMMNNENRFRLSTLDLFPLHQKNELNHHHQTHHHMDASSSSSSSMSPLIHRVQRQFHRSGSPVIPGSPSFDKVLNMMLGIRIAQQQITQMWNMRLYGGTLMSHPNNHNHNNNSNNNENRIMKLYARDCNYIMSFELPRVMATSNNSSSSHSRSSSSSSSNSSSSMMMVMDSLFMDQSNPPVQQTPLDDQHEQTNSQRSSKNFVFKDYAPLVFRSIRSRFGISEDEYAMALAPEQLLGNLLVGRLTTLTEKITDGKSGNFFFYSHNGQYLCKTISAGELETFLRILPKYYNHMCRYKDTLITRYYGLHCLNDTVFVVMGNVFQTSYKMDCVFDLKGSTVGRSAFTNAEECVKADSEKLKSKILKDLDWMALQKKLTLGEVSGKFLHQLTIDTKLLEECEIIDYSLLVGMRKLPRVLPPHHIDETSSLPFHQQFEGGILFGDTVLYLGIIDTLIEYGVKKKVEHNIKSLYYGDGTGISVTDPKNYATRFLAFLHTQVPGDLSTIYY